MEGLAPNGQWPPRPAALDTIGTAQQHLRLQGRARTRRSIPPRGWISHSIPVSYTHLRAHETGAYL
eukprot:5247949-Pyramimonas_sp.AAC.1